MQVRFKNIKRATGFNMERFNSQGAAIEKALSPFDFRRDLGIVN